MTQVIFNNGVAMSLGAVSRMENLRPKCCILVNAPPADGRCYVCGRHMSELKPFGGPGDPLVGDFTGELLVKRWRWVIPYDDEAERAWDEAKKEVPEGEDKRSWFLSKYGEERGEEFYHYSQGVDTTWECRDCIVMDYDEYFKIIAEQCRALMENESTGNP